MGRGAIIIVKDGIMVACDNKSCVMNWFHPGMCCAISYALRIVTRCFKVGKE